MPTNGQLNDTRGYHIKPTNSTCNLISCFRLKGRSLSVRDKNYFQRSQILLSKSVIKEKYFYKYKNKKMYAKISVALGVCFSIGGSDVEKKCQS